MVGRVVSDAVAAPIGVLVEDAAAADVLVPVVRLVAAARVRGVIDGRSVAARLPPAVNALRSTARVGVAEDDAGATRDARAEVIHRAGAAALSPVVVTLRSAAVVSVRKHVAAATLVPSPVVDFGAGAAILPRGVIAGLVAAFPECSEDDAATARVLETLVHT